MKLLNREPTEEMLEIALKQRLLDALINCPEKAAIRKLFEAMYDAAPEIKIDMEPVAWMHVSRHGTHFGKADNALRPHAVNLYSTEQVAAMQTENERLRKGVKQIQHVLKDNEEWGLRSDRAVRWALLSVDNLIAKYEGEKHG